MKAVVIWAVVAKMTRIRIAHRLGPSRGGTNEAFMMTKPGGGIQQGSNEVSDVLLPKAARFRFHFFHPLQGFRSHYPYLLPQDNHPLKLILVITSQIRPVLLDLQFSYPQNKDHQRRRKAMEKGFVDPKGILWTRDRTHSLYRD